MITTVTLNPALDKIYTIADFAVNKLFYLGDFSRLLSNKEIDTVTTLPGGKGINVALFLHKLAIKTLAMGIIGGHTGRMVEELLLREGVNIHFQYGTGTTRTNLAIIDTHKNSLTLINEPGDPILEEELDTFKKKFNNILDKSETIVLSGSIPTGTDPEFYATLTEMARAKKKTVILNSSKGAFNYGVEAGPSIVLPDLRTGASVLGHSLTQNNDFIELAHTIFNKNKNIKTIILPKMPEGMIFFITKSFIWEITFQDMLISNLLGFADQIIGGLIYAQIGNWNDEECFKFAAAAGLANAESSAKLVTSIKTINKCLERLTVKKYST